MGACDDRYRAQHDYRAFYQPDGSYHAVCETCGHDFGPVDMTGLTIIYGTGTVSKQTIEVDHDDRA